MPAVHRATCSRVVEITPFKLGRNITRHNKLVPELLKTLVERNVTNARNERADFALPRSLCQHTSASRKNLAERSLVGVLILARGRRSEPLFVNRSLIVGPPLAQQSSHDHKRVALHLL